jgi:hypothetical protein
MVTSFRPVARRLTLLVLGGCAVAAPALSSGCANGNGTTAATGSGGGAEATTSTGVGGATSATTSGSTSATTSSSGTGAGGDATSSSSSATSSSATTSSGSATTSSSSATTSSSSGATTGATTGGSSGVTTGATTSGSTTGAGGATSGSSTGASGSGGSSSTGAGGSDNPTGITLTGSNATPQFGNLNGGVLYPDACPAGQVVVGFSGFLASQGYHGKMQASCGIPTVSGSGPFTVTISAGGTTPLRGLFGVTAWSSMCPANQMVVGFGGRSGALLDQLAVRCAPLVIAGGPGAYTIAIGAVTTLAAVGDNGGNAFAITNCAVGQVATMARLRAGDGIDAFGIACSAVGLLY